MSTAAQTPRAATAAPVRRGRPAAARRSRALAGGVAWILLFAALLSGVVAVNVADLRLNLHLDRTGRERAELRAEIADLRSELSSAAATARIEKLAEQELGLVRADPDSTVFLRLEK